MPTRITDAEFITLCKLVDVADNQKEYAIRSKYEIIEGHGCTRQNFYTRRKRFRAEGRVT